MSDVEGLIATLDQIPHSGSYHICREPLSSTPVALRRELLKILAAQFENRISSLRLPESILIVYRQNVARIRTAADDAPDSYFDVDYDPFLKDVGIVLQRVIPAGAEVLTEGGLGRRLLVQTRGVGRARLALAVWKAGGFAPYFEYHTHDLVLEDFNEVGFRQFYRRVADLLELRPDVKGLFARTWFLDPALARVSPRLAYLRQIPVVEGNALELNVGSTAQDVALATLKSPTRKALHAAGHYHPTAYVNIWFREALLKWARQSKH